MKTLTYFSISSLAVDHRRSERVYAGLWSGGVRRSDDGGTTWETVSKGMPEAMTVYALLIVPQAPSTLYAATDGGVFKTTDRGRHWKRTGLGRHEVFALVFNPETPSILYAGTDKDLFKSVDGGFSWVRCGLTTTGVFALAINPKTPEILYAGWGEGVSRSRDGATTWSTISTGWPDSTYVSALAIDPMTPSKVYAGTPRGIFTLNR